MPIGLEVITPGFLTTVQDRGRFGYQALGMPTAGALDPFAARIANLLVGNAQDAALLEITLRGPTLEVAGPLVFALTGADLGATLNGEPLPMWRAVAARPGDRITFESLRSGCRAYLAVAGGIDVPPVLGSRSTYLRGGIGGLEGRPLKAGDTLRIGPLSPDAPARVGWGISRAWIPRYQTPITLRVVLGPQADHFTQAGIETFLRSEYTVSVQSDRMGCRLDGPGIAHARGADIISDGVPLGAVQVPGHGMPIVMLADRQTTGGYPKIATVIGADLPHLAQARPGDRVRFRAVSRSEALARLREQEMMVRRLETYLRTMVKARGGAHRAPASPVLYHRASEGVE